MSRSVLIPNERGLDLALAQRDHFDEINVFLSASESHNRKNVNRSVEESLTGLERVARPRPRGEGLRCEGVISVAFGCPYEGHVPPERVFEIAQRLSPRGGGDRVRRHDRDGQPGPGRALLPAGPRGARRAVELTAHFHNTRGQGLANVYAA